MNKTITLSSAPGTASIYGKAVAAMLPVIGKPAKVSATATVPDTRYRLADVRVVRLRCKRIAGPRGNGSPRRCR